MEILDRARARYILGDRKNIPEAQNAVESVLRTEMLDAIPKSIAESCMRHGYCTAELIVWYVMKQLILPHDINEVTMQREVHPRTVITFVQEVLSGITQYDRTVGNIWDALYLKHQLRESNLTLERVYAMLAEFFIELRLHEEQDKITQIVNGSGGSWYIYASIKIPTYCKTVRFFSLAWDLLSLFGSSREFQPLFDYGYLVSVQQGSRLEDAAHILLRFQWGFAWPFRRQELRKQQHHSAGPPPLTIAMDTTWTMDMLLSSTPCMMSRSVPARGRCLPKGKANSEMAKVHNLNGDHHAMIIGSQAVAHKVITVQSIIQGDSQADAQYVVLPDILLHNVPVQSNPRPSMPTGMNPRVLGKTLNGRMLHARMKSMKPRKAGKGKGKALSPKASLRGRFTEVDCSKTNTVFTDKA